MSVINKKKVKKERGVMFKIMNRDPDDPLYHDPGVPNKMLVYTPSLSDMKKKKLTEKQEQIILEMTEEHPSMDLENFDESKDQIDYVMDQYKRDLKEIQDEAEGEGEYYEAEELEAEGDEDYEFMGFNNKVDRDFAKEVHQNYKFKPAEGVKMVEYDAFGLPKTKEMEMVKKELNLRDEDAIDDDDVDVMYIKPPEEYVLHGYHRNVDIERKKMNKDMKEVFDLMEDDQRIPTELSNQETIDDDFLNQLNDGLPAVVQKGENGESQTKEMGNVLDMDELRKEADDMLTNMPPELSLDMQIKLAGAREHLALKNKEVEHNPEIQAHIDKNFEDMLEQYKDEDIGITDPNQYESFGDEIDQDEFDEILQEFINQNPLRCKKMLSNYINPEFESKIKIGDGPNEILNTTVDAQDAVYRLLKQKNGEIVRLVSKEFMDKYKKEMNEQEHSATKAQIKEKILRFAEEWMDKVESGEADKDVPEREVAGEGDQEDWDVESILSTRTNTDNHPGIIKSVVKVKKNRIKLDPKTRAPELNEDKPTDKPKPKKLGPYVEQEVSDGEGEDFDEEIDPVERAKMDKKQIKKQLKKERRERRAMKKQMKKEFARMNQKYVQARTVEVGAIRPGTSIRKL